MNRNRVRKRTPRPGPLQHALQALQDAVDDLTAPQPHHPGWVPSRYRQLTEAIDITASRAGAGRGTNSAPIWIDPWMLADRIETRTYKLTSIRDTIPRCWHHALTETHWRPQDQEHIEAITTEIQAWCQAIDDLFAPKPAYLPDPCPHCRQTHTHKLTDDGQHVRTPALAVTAERGAWCQSCRDEFHPIFLGRLLGYITTENIPA